jgi:hypothetical protein
MNDSQQLSVNYKSAQAATKKRKQKILFKKMMKIPGGKSQLMNNKILFIKHSTIKRNVVALWIFLY